MNKYLFSFFAVAPGAPMTAINACEPLEKLTEGHIEMVRREVQDRVRKASDCADVYLIVNNIIKLDA